jgi:wyosine [tRNA(Phe)-imidazoG37] synthetase (radical SAM superfamily)
MAEATTSVRPLKRKAPAPVSPQTKTAFGEPRNFFGNHYVYLVVSQRARGLSVGINLNPDQACNFNCVYCEVDRTRPARDKRVNVRIMAEELKTMLVRIREGQIRAHPYYRGLPPDLLEFREIALSGNGEPTLCPNFAEVVQKVVHVRAQAVVPFFKIVLITNGTELRQPRVRQGLSCLTDRDSIWVKLDVGTQAVMDKVNRAQSPLRHVLANIRWLGRQRPIVIQSLFPLLEGQEPTAEEIEAYVRCLAEIQRRGASISLVQIYSAHRPTPLPDCGHVSLACLSRIAQRVREVTGLDAEVF